MDQINEWIGRRKREDDRLYEKYGKPLEAEHTGEFVAIGPNGETILGTDNWALTDEATARFGPATYCLRRIGYLYELRIR